MNKKIIVMLLICFIVTISLAYKGAAEPVGNPLGDKSIYKSVQEINQQYGDSDESDLRTFWGDVHPDNSIVARIFTNVVKAIIESLWKYFGIHDPVTLFFNVDPKIIFNDSSIDPEKLNKTLYVDPEEAYLYTFNDKERSMINSVFDAFQDFLKIPYAVAVSIVGLIIFMQGFGAQERSAAKTLIGGMLMFPAMLKFFPYVLEPLFWLNYTIIRAIGSVLMNPEGLGWTVSPLTRPFVTILIGSGTELGSLGVVIGTLCLFVMTSLINFQYFVRRFMLALLIMMFPVVAFLQIFPGTRHTFRMWWSEFTANLFLQSAHAMVYLMFVTYVYEAKLPFVPVMAMLATLNSMTVFIRNLMGCRPGSGVASIASSMVGLSALLGAARITKGIIGGIGKSIPAYSTAEPPRGSGGVSSDKGSSTQSLTETAQTEGVSEGIQTTGEVVTAGETATQLPQQPAGSPSGSESLKGPVWGLKPRLPSSSVFSLIGKTAVGVGTVGAVAAGALVGGAAMGPAGLGIGAMTATELMEVATGIGNRGVGLVNNYIAREKIIADVMKKHPELDREQAAVFAATGVNATPEEIKYDDVMRKQYANFMNITGIKEQYEGMPKIPKPHFIESSLKSNETKKIEEKIENIRAKTARERELYLNSNPTAAPQDVNRYILENVIRPELSKETE